MKSFQEVNQQIKNIQKQIMDITKPLNEQLDELFQKQRELCPHDTLHYSAAWADAEWPDVTYYPAYVTCNDCGLTISSHGDGEEFKLFCELEKKGEFKPTKFNY